MQCSSIKRSDKYRAETSRDALQQIVKDTPANVSAAAAINLPTLESLR